MGQPEIIRGIFESAEPFTLEEASGEVDGKAIIGKIKGNFFVPNGFSRNKRYYSENLWRKQLERSDIKQRLQERRMLGTIGHDPKLDENDILEGKVSHIISVLEVKGPKQGYGEALILDTPAGRILNTLGKAGVKLFTSSRADGKYSGTQDGVPCVDEDKYHLQRFDFVLDPGFLEASPEMTEGLSSDQVEVLKESINQLKNICSNINVDNLEEKMSDRNTNKELLEQLVKENGSIKGSLDDSLRENTKLEEDLDIVTDENNHLKEQLKKYTDQDQTVKAYEGLGTPEEIEKSLEEANNELKGYREIGTVEDINTAFDEGRSLLNKYKEIGTIEEIKQALSIARDEIKEYREIGTVQEIKEAFDKTQILVNSTKSQKDEKKIKELATELKVSEEAVKKVYGKLSEAEIKEFFKDVSETNKYGQKYRKNTKDESNLNEGRHKKAKIFEESAGQELMNSLG